MFTICRLSFQSPPLPFEHSAHRMRRGVRGSSLDGVPPSFPKGDEDACARGALTEYFSSASSSLARNSGLKLTLIPRGKSMTHCSPATRKEPGKRGPRATEPLSILQPRPGARVADTSHQELRMLTWHSPVRDLMAKSDDAIISLSASTFSRPILSAYRYCPPRGLLVLADVQVYLPPRAVQKHTAGSVEEESSCSVTECNLLPR